MLKMLHKVETKMTMTEGVVGTQTKLTQVLWNSNKKVGNVTHVTVFYCIKKLGYTFKKSHGYIKSETKKKEESL
jgi:hypothetical protein